jgi:hypothetical protein
MIFFRPDFKTKTRIFSAKKLQNPDSSKKSMDSLFKLILNVLSQRFDFQLCSSVSAAASKRHSSIILSRVFEFDAF